MHRLLHIRKANYLKDQMCGKKSVKEEGVGRNLPGANTASIR